MLFIYPAINGDVWGAVENFLQGHFFCVQAAYNFFHAAKIHLSLSFCGQTSDKWMKFESIFAELIISSFTYKGSYRIFFMSKNLTT